MPSFAVVQGNARDDRRCTSWTRQFATIANAMAIDASGNVFVAGEFTATSREAELRKYGPTGSLSWSRQIGTASEEAANAVAVDLAGNVFVAGLTGSSLAGQPRVAQQDVFVQKYDAAGTLLTLVFLPALYVAVYGARNPHKISDVLTAETPVNPSDIYGQHKVEAEALVHASDLNWVILRLGGVLPSEPSFDMNRDLLLFEGVLPADGRLQTVDVRDVARAFAAATLVDEALGQTLLIGGDDTHRQRQGDIASATTEAMGTGQLMPHGRPGDPDSDTAWFATDWMDSATAHKVLGHQHHPLSETLADTAAYLGWKRYPMKLAAPVVRRYFAKNNVYQGVPGPYADLWNTIGTKWGEPGPDGGAE